MRAFRIEKRDGEWRLTQSHGDGPVVVTTVRCSSWREAWARVDARMAIAQAQGRFAA